MKKKGKKTEEKSEKAFWSVFGKISSGIFVFVAIITIYSFFSAKKVQLKAECSYSDFQWPPDLDELIKILQKRSSPGEVVKFIDAITSANKSASEQKFDGNRFEFARIYYSFLTEDLQKYPFEKLKYSGFWQFRIFNSGNLPADKVVLDIPVKGIAKIEPTKGEFDFSETDKNDIVIKEFSNKLEIGEIRPGNSITILLWTINQTAEKNIHLSYATGIGKLAFQKNFFGFNTSTIQILFVLFSIIFATYTFASFLYSKIETKKYQIIKEQVENTTKKSSSSKKRFRQK